MSTPTPTADDRLAAVRRYEILDAPADGTFDEVARLATTVFGVPISTVSIVDTDRVWFAAAQGLDGVTQVGTEPGLCASVVLGDGPYVVNDAALDPRTLEHPLVRGELGLRFYAAAPIVTADGHRLGTVTVMDSHPREVSELERTVLTQLATIVSTHLEVRLAALQAVRAERLLREEADRRAERAASLQEARLAQGPVDRPAQCQLGSAESPCAEPAELRIADGWGNGAWGCVSHAEEALFAPGAFIANDELGGLSAYLDRR